MCCWVTRHSLFEGCLKVLCSWQLQAVTSLSVAPKVLLLSASHRQLVPNDRGGRVAASRQVSRDC